MINKSGDLIGSNNKKPEQERTGCPLKFIYYNRSKSKWKI